MVATKYWSRRADFMYYRYIEAIVGGVGSAATSLLDVGSANAAYLEEFDWIGKRVALDREKVYSSEAVQGIQTDFFTYVPDERFDLVTCFQVLEHIPDAGPFARKLFDVGRSVLISVPFKWPVGATKHHVHDPVDAEKLLSWTGRKPDYSVIVSELFLKSKSRRLISYYHDPAKQFDLAEARAAVKKSKRKAD